MKNATQRRSMAVRAQQKMMLLLVLISISHMAGAQTSPPSATHHQYAYPTAAASFQATNSSNYSIQHGMWAANTWLLVNSWEFGCAGTGFSWQCVTYTTPGVPGTFESGSMMLPAGATDVNVGIIRNGPSGIQVDVSFYQAGVGHFVNIYNWNLPAYLAGPGTGCILATSKQLSCLTNYTRISMDTHIGYGTAIVWEDYTAGANDIHVIAANNNNFGPVFTLTGTAGHITPDVAFVHTGPLDIHIASYDPTMGNIMEYFVNWGNIIPGGGAAGICGFPALCSTCALGVTVVDNNTVASAPNSLHIDAPDHYGSANWAYTYEINNDIFCRIMNPNVPPWAAPASGAAATVCFTDGSYTAPFYPACCTMPTINTSTNNVPVIAWDHSATPVGGINQFSFYVAWHTSYNSATYNPTSNAYIAIQVNEDGLVRNPLPVPFNWLGVSNTPANTSSMPTIALSKCNDQSPFLYSVFSENTVGNYLENRWTVWNIGVFKPGQSGIKESTEITINPNPFKNNLSMNFPHDFETETVKVRVTDILGREYGSYNSPMYGANDFLGNVAKQLIPGNYNVSVECKVMKFQKVFKVTKVD